MSAEEVIAETMKQLAGTNSSQETFAAYAGVILADLKVAGYRIVKMPPPRKPFSDRTEPSTGEPFRPWVGMDISERDDPKVHEDERPYCLRCGSAFPADHRCGRDQ